MRTVKLVKGVSFDQRKVYTDVMSNPDPRQGSNFSDMKRRMKIIDVLEKLPDGAAVIDLEDADYEFLKGTYAGFAFVAPHKDFIMFGEALGIT
jgi:hypothetical protein